MDNPSNDFNIIQLSSESSWSSLPSSYHTIMSENDSYDEQQQPVNQHDEQINDDSFIINNNNQKYKINTGSLRSMIKSLQKIYEKTDDNLTKIKLKHCLLLEIYIGTNVMYNLTTSLKNLEFIINIIEPMLENSSEIEQLYRINQKYIDDINNYYEPNIIVNKKGRKRKRGRKKKQLLLLNSDRQPEQQHQQEPKRIYRRRKFPESDRKTRKRFKIDENHNEKQLIKSTPVTKKCLTKKKTNKLQTTIELVENDETTIEDDDYRHNHHNQINGESNHTYLIHLNGDDTSNENNNNGTYQNQHQPEDTFSDEEPIYIDTSDENNFIMNSKKSSEMIEKPINQPVKMAEIFPLIKKSINIDTSNANNIDTLESNNSIINQRISSEEIEKIGYINQSIEIAEISEMADKEESTTSENHPDLDLLPSSSKRNDDVTSTQNTEKTRIQMNDDDVEVIVVVDDDDDEDEDIDVVGIDDDDDDESIKIHTTINDNYENDIEDGRTSENLIIDDDENEINDNNNINSTDMDHLSMTNNEQQPISYDEIDSIANESLMVDNQKENLTNDNNHNIDNSKSITSSINEYRNIPIKFVKNSKPLYCCLNNQFKRKSPTCPEYYEYSKEFVKPYLKDPRMHYLYQPKYYFRQPLFQFRFKDEGDF
ncbi:uncharacterized protein LOC113798168 isoform X2 [Dermatophagoides pteronyssinus]|uniref:uncharacterized protein LOC113798168 isoform X2 n=1 Tax=Dermatophagoides pteronyssinus TaxID=6956 RepID=UPI003F67CE53